MSQPTVVKKRGGRPNRGGGRFNQPRGRGGGGRGAGRGSQGGRGGGRGRGGGPGSQGGQQQRQQGGARPQGPRAETGARKGKGVDMMYDDDDFVLMPRQEKTSSSGYQCSSVHRQMIRPSIMCDFILYSGRSYNQSHQGRRRAHPSSKVKMQSLHMSDENQELVKDVLRELHGTEMDFDIDEEDYEELDYDTARHFWTDDNSLVVEAAGSVFSPLVAWQAEGSDSNAEKEKQQFSKYAVEKLIRCGYPRQECMQALEGNDGDAGLALEQLYRDFTKSLQLTLDKDALDDSVSMEDALEQRQEEALALSAIYGSDFTERIPNHVWTMKLELSHINRCLKETHVNNKKRTERRGPPSGQRRNVCHFYQQGHCKFGSKCKFFHDPLWDTKDGAAEQASSEAVEDNKWFLLEIRFPKDNLYPWEPPIIGFSSTHPDFQTVRCLNVTKRLASAAAEQAPSGSPAVFSLVGILEDEEDIAAMLVEKLVRFQSSKSSASKSRVQDEEVNDGNDEPSEAAGEEIQEEPLSSQSAEISKEIEKQSAVLTGRDGAKSLGKSLYVPPKRSRKDEEKDNRRLKDQFRRSQTSSAYKAMMGRRETLPAWKEQDNILETLDEYQVLVVSGATGCGKTTQVPQFILDTSLKKKGPELCNIICTQPRRISATAVAERVAKERTTRIGDIVGYQIRLENKQSSSTRLTFCTTGILLRRLESDPELSGVSHVIVDEVHERSEESDFLMMVLRDMLPQRPDLRVILMSATLNADLFSQYFFNCPVINIPGKTFPVDQYFLEDAIEFTGYVLDENSPLARPLKRSNAAPSEASARALGKVRYADLEEDIAAAFAQTTFTPAADNVRDSNLTVPQMTLRYSEYEMSTIKTLATIDPEKLNNDLIEELVKWIVDGDHEYPKDGAILIFLPGMGEISDLYEQLQSSLCGPRKKKKYKLVPLHSSLSSDEQNAAFDKPQEGVTKIVIATNIAETSITIDDIVYVIDAGRMKEKRYDSGKRMESLETVWVSKANAMQRRGRAGRVAAGVCFHLFTNHTFGHVLRDQQQPEIQRIPLEQLVLRIKILDVFQGYHVKDVLNKLLEPPKTESIDDAVQRLQDLGALSVDQDLTSLGYHLASLPVDVRIGKLMLFGAIFQCLDPVLTIAASLSFRSPFMAPFDKRDQADKKRLDFAVGNSDHLTLLRAYKGWTTALDRSNYFGYRYCHENFLSVKTLQMIASMKHQFAELLGSIGFVDVGMSARQMDRKSNGFGDMILKACHPQVNTNANNDRLIVAVLCAALYPNVVQVLTPEAKYSLTSSGAIPMNPKAQELKFKTKDDGYVNVHPKSVNFQVRYYESPYLVFLEKVKTSKVYIRDCSMVSVYPLLLFGGCELNIDLKAGEFIISLDSGWIQFKVKSIEVGELMRELRRELDQLLADKIQQPDMDLNTCPRGSRIIAAIVQLISTQ
ncbi:LOW QUALITY PROTEIN: putative ATP-dependent RNA helicase DHX57 [Diadema setosum]|uniref:LOW QUALITY PROTEIN: putative ATP-dependent RNA helicase DHX57 n=1 Tax=Diadema setosum TaxID=31175 RepID=UPI003B3BADDF